jgi:hypothetical protein
LEGCILGASRLIDQQPSEEAGAGSDPGAEPGVAADRAKDGTDTGTCGGAGQRSLLGWGHVGARNDRQPQNAEPKQLSHSIPPN